MALAPFLVHFCRKSNILSSTRQPVEASRQKLQAMRQRELSTRKPQERSTRAAATIGIQRSAVADLRDDSSDDSLEYDDSSEDWSEEDCDDKQGRGVDEGMEGRDGDEDDFMVEGGDEAVLETLGAQHGIHRIVGRVKGMLDTLVVKLTGE